MFAVERNPQRIASVIGRIPAVERLEGV
jgi:hypothetical protein